MKNIFSLKDHTLFQKILKIAALTFVGAGLLINEFVLGLFANDGVVDFPEYWPIRVFQIFVFVFGVLLFFSVKRFQKLTAFLIGIAIAAFTLVLFEIVFFILLQNEPVVIEKYSEELFEFEQPIGYRLKPDNSVRAIKLVDSDTIYDVTYNIDKYGRRVTKENLKVFCDSAIVAFGCSHTFGVGLEDDQTIPSFLQEKFPNHNVYNYGVPGYGPHQTYFQIKSTNLNKEVYEKEVIGLYLYMEDHIQRAIGSYQVFSSWGRNMPCFKVENDELKYKGTFLETNTSLATWYSFFNKSSFLKYIDFNWPPLTQGHYNLNKKLLGAIQDNFYKKYPDGRMYIVILPSKSDQSEWILSLQEDFNIIDLSGIFFKDFDLHTIPGDFHPNPKANDLISTYIEQIIHNPL